MGSNTLVEDHLQNIEIYLIDFERTKKKVEGNLIHKWFNTGEILFEKFYSLGNSIQWKRTAIKKDLPGVTQVISLIAKNQGWLQTFITFYPSLRIDLEGTTPAVDVCRIRSGIEFLLRGFVGIDKEFDKVLKDLKVFGELKEFDEHLKVWVEYYRPDFYPEDLHSDTPKAHWWWF